MPFDQLPRVKLCRAAVTMGVRADVGLSDYTDAYRDHAAGLDNAGILRSFVPSETYDRYQVHVDIDGNSNSWPGLLSKLHSGGAVLKVASQQGYRQWYYDRLEPWIHYVPVRADLADLEEKADLLLGDPVLAERVGRAGQALARDMTLEAEIARIMPIVGAAFEPITSRPYGNTR